MQNRAFRNGESWNRGGRADGRRCAPKAARLLGVSIAAASFLAGGTACVEIAGLLGLEGIGSNPGDDGTDPGNGGDNGGGGNGGGGGVDPSLAVRISASNVTPVVGEEVLLVCSLISADDAGVSFAFEPANLLIADGVSSTASLIVDAALVGQAISFTCRARSGGEEGPPSDPVTLTVTGP